jgi:hypothetical protein
MAALVRAIAIGDPRLAYRSFFPVSAYVQTKAYSDAAVDWRVRLIAGFDADVATYHRELGPRAPAARLVSYAVDESAAVWVLPGEEYNKGPYWRVYDTTITYAIGRQTGSIGVTTMISWRGEWYVVHLSAIR